MNKLPIIDRYAARVLMISFFLPMHWQVIAVFVSCIYFVVRALYSEVKIPGANYIWATVLGSGYFLYLLAFLFTPEPFRKELSKLCEHKVSFLLMPFAFAIIAPVFGRLIRQELIYFVYACFAVCLVANFIVLHDLYIIHHGLHGFFHVEYRNTFQDVTDIHPTYMSMYLCFGISILLFVPTGHSQVKNIAKYTLLYALVIFSMTLLAKSPLIALVIITGHYAWMHRKELYRYKMVIAGAVGLIVGAYFFIPFVGQRVNETLQLFSKSKAENVTDNSLYARELIWSTDKQVLKNYWLTGTGPGRLLHTLNEHYFFYSLGNGFAVPYYDPHNEYLWEWLSFGITGLVIFVGIFAVYLIKAIKVKNYLSLYFLLILYITFFTESVLSTQRGILLFAVFAAFFFYLPPHGEKKRGLL